MPSLMTTTEVAAHLRVSADTLRYWRYVRKGPKSFRLGRRVLYALEDVNAWLEEARQSGTST